jgi:flagellar basal body-associated protein FliL
MTGNPKLDKILLALNATVALLAAGVVYYAHFMIKPPPTNQSGEEQALVDKAYQETQITPYTMKTQIVNLYTEGARLRFLSTEMSLIPFKEAGKALLKEREYIIRNALISVAAHMTAEEVSSVTGKILLESRVKKTINEALGAPVVKKIYFGKFTVQ